MEVTKREITFSTIILCVMIGLGLLISKPIITSVTDNARNIAAATQVNNNNELFDYIRRTDVGNFIAEGKLYSLDTIRISDIPGGYAKIKKLKQKYTMHTRTVTTTDSKGHTHSHTEVYWSWDTVHRDEWTSKRFSFLGHTFTPSEIKYNIVTGYNTTIKESANIRYEYYTAPIDDYGIITGVADNKRFKETVFEHGTIEKKIKSVNADITATPIIFWVFWLLLTGGLIALFYYYENKWLY